MVTVSLSKLSSSHCFRLRFSFWHVTYLSSIFWIAAYLHHSLFHYFTTTSTLRSVDPCSGRYIYIHNLPSRFNSDILSDYLSVNLSYTNMCRFISNAGLGPPLNYHHHSINNTSSLPIYSTDPYSLDLIFHNRIKHYPCLTANSSLSSAIFIPFYAGLDFGRYQWDYNISVRDSLPIQLAHWLSSTPEWHLLGGRDHFMVAGRTTWDFRRFRDEDNLWGNKLLLLPQMHNVSTLVFESDPWDSNDVAVPYPTYFHPCNHSQLLSWQDRVRSSERQWLFAFAGAPRENSESVRGQVIDQCRASAKCNLLECGSGLSECHSPVSVMTLFESASFCLQPPGDTPTRKSVFDAMVSGCVPVFFDRRTAYNQYTWYLPKEHKRYSVFIAEEEVRRGGMSIEEVLSGYSEDQVRAMREEVVRLIPRLIYGDPRSRPEGFQDAVDVAVDGVLRRVARLR